MIKRPDLTVVFLLSNDSFQTVPGGNTVNGAQNAFMLFTSKAFNSL